KNRADGEVQPEPGGWADQQSGPNGDQSELCREILRSPEECDGAVDASDHAEGEYDDAVWIYPKHAFLPFSEPHPGGDHLQRRAVCGIQQSGRVDFWIVWKSVSDERGHELHARRSHVQVGRGDSTE